MTGATLARRRALLRQLMAEANLACRAGGPARLHLLAVAHTAIAAVDAGMAESEGEFR
jgi:hypothetical protein